jgi:hypothetical protein
MIIADKGEVARPWRSRIKAHHDRQRRAVEISTIGLSFYRSALSGLAFSPNRHVTRASPAMTRITISQPAPEHIER